MNPHSILHHCLQFIVKPLLLHPTLLISTQQLHLRCLSLSDQQAANSIPFPSNNPSLACTNAAMITGTDETDRPQDLSGKYRQALKDTVCRRNNLPDLEDIGQKPRSDQLYSRCDQTNPFRPFDSAWTWIGV